MRRVLLNSSSLITILFQDPRDFPDPTELPVAMDSPVRTVLPDLPDLPDPSVPPVDPDLAERTALPVPTENAVSAPSTAPSMVESSSRTEPEGE